MKLPFIWYVTWYIPKKRQNLLFLHLKNSKMAQNGKKWHFSCSILLLVSSPWNYLSFDMSHATYLKIDQIGVFCIKKTQKWQKMAKNDFLEKCEKNIIFKWPYCSKMPKTSKIRSKLHFLVRKNGNLALFWGFSLKKNL